MNYAKLESKLTAGSERDGNGCLIWCGYTRPDGYAYITVATKKKRGVHQIAWMLANGPIPEGMCICHTCDVRTCVEPSHLFLGTKGDNNRDMIAKGRNRAAPGERNGAAKLTDADVLRIRAIGHGVSSKVLASTFGVSRTAIQRARNGQRWRHL